MDLAKELLELHEKMEGTHDTWCDACVSIGDDSGEVEAGHWPCDTVVIIHEHYPELAKETP